MIVVHGGEGMEEMEGRGGGGDGGEGMQGTGGEGEGRGGEGGGGGGGRRQEVTGEVTSATITKQQLKIMAQRLVCFRTKYSDYNVCFASVSRHSYGKSSLR
jgi:hypothetical protein